MESVHSVENASIFPFQHQPTTSDNVTGSFSATLTALMEPIDVRSAGVDDLSLLSPERLYGFTPEKPGAVTIDELEYHGRKQLDDFSHSLTGLLREEGIDITGGIDLGVENGSGRVIVKGDHPDKERIEEIINEETGLRNDYVRATNMLIFAEHGRHAAQFHQAYALDPVAAVAQYSYLFNSDVQAHVHVDEEGVEIAMEWVSK